MWELVLNDSSCTSWIVAAVKGMEGTYCVSESEKRNWFNLHVMKTLVVFPEMVDLCYQLKKNFIPKYENLLNF